MVNADAFVWLADTGETFDVVIADFPDPHNFSLGKLYSRTFYRVLRARLAPGGLAALQATSPMFARRSFWCIVETVRSAGLAARPYHAYVPSFGEWGFVLAGDETWAPPRAYPPGFASSRWTRRRRCSRFRRTWRRCRSRSIASTTRSLVHYYGAEWQRM